MIRTLFRKAGWDLIRFPSKAIESQVEKIQLQAEEIDLLKQHISSLENQIEADKISCTYDSDWLKVWHKDTSFLMDPKFLKAYEKGMDSGHKILREKGSKKDIGISWRVYVLCWAAKYCSQLEGHFVECGVNTGICSLAICDYIGIESLNKTLYLFDTFEGIPLEQSQKSELEKAKKANKEFYEDCFATAKNNFSPYPNVKLIKGKVPDSLAEVEIDKVAFLHIDMNIALPEKEALKHFWPKLEKGAIVILDDYGWVDYAEQKKAIDNLSKDLNFNVLTLPTGQGLILKN